MKKPTRPRKPSKPEPPEEFYEDIEAVNNSLVDRLDIGDWTYLTIAELLAKIQSYCKDLTDKDIPLDELYITDIYHGIFEISTRVLKRHKNYEKKLAAYKKKLASYDEDMRKYEDRLKTYKINLPIWKAYQLAAEQDKHRNEIADLQKQLDKLNEQVGSLEEQKQSLLSKTDG